MDMFALCLAPRVKRRIAARRDIFFSHLENRGRMCYIGYEVDIMKSKSDSMKRKVKARCEDCLYYDCDENGEYYEKVSYYCECTKCGISTPFMSCEEAAADCWEGTFATASGGGNREQKGVAAVAEWR